MSRRAPTASRKMTSDPSTSISSSLSASSKSSHPVPPRPQAFSTLRTLHLADYITLLNGFSGTMSILCSMHSVLPHPTTASSTTTTTTTTSYSPSPSSTIWLALAFMPLGFLADVMDGKVARMRGKGAGSALGQELDSLADLISFGVAPAVAAFALGLRSPLDMLCLTFFVLCGLTRLARFNVTVDQIPRDKGGKSLYFEGVPIPTSLALVAGMAVALWMGVLGGVGAVSGGGGGKAGLEMEMVVPGGVLLGGTLVEVHPIVAVFALWGCAMLSRRVRVPKL